MSGSRLHSPTLANTTSFLINADHVSAECKSLVNNARCNVVGMREQLVETVW